MHVILFRLLCRLKLVIVFKTVSKKIVEKICFESQIVLKIIVISINHAD